MRILLALPLVFLFAVHTFAQDVPLTWSGQLRLRGEGDGRDFRQGNALNAYALSRARLGVEARPSDDITVFLQIQDSRVFGGEVTSSGQFSTLADTKNLDLHQGYFEVRHMLAEPLSVRAGRMQLRYGNERMIGAVDWNNVGRSFDGALVRIDGGATVVDVFAMNTGETSVPPAAATPPSVEGKRDTGQALYGAYAAMHPADWATLDAYALYQTNVRQTESGSADLLRLTVGLQSMLRGADASVELEAAYQAGSAGSRTISAYLLAAAVSYRTGGSIVSSIRGSVEALSGTPEGDAGVKTFDPPFHTGHKFYGWMDYFINIPAQTYNRGLLDINVACAGKFAEQVSWTVKAHTFALMQQRNGQKALGQEVDLLVSWAYAKALTFDLGASAFVPGVNMRETFGASSVGLWAYLAATVTL